jgi:MoxR-like ATPase
MKASEILQALEVLILSGNPAHIEGEPGVGKTALVTQCAKALKRDLIYTRLADRDPIDFRGMPVVDVKAGTTKWLTPDEFPKQGCKPTIWFIDEWAQGIPAVQNVAGQLLNERRLGEYVLPDNVYICAASNRAKDRAATNKIPSHIADRFSWLTLEADAGDWCKWAFANTIETETIAFIRWREELLSKFDPSQQVSPTCRSWEKLSNVLRTIKAQKQKLPATIEERIYAGIVGNGAAAEFVGFLSIFRKLTDPAAMLANPDLCEIPTDPATLCAVCAGLSRKVTDASMDRLMRISNRMQDEYSVLLMALTTGRDAELASTRAYIEWAVAHSEALL